VILDKFRKSVVKPLTTHCPILNGFRVATAYEDVQNTYALVQEFQIEVGEHDIFDAAKSEDEAAVHRAMQIHSRLSTHFKALFVFADIFVSVLLSETIGKPGLTLNKFIEKPQLPLLGLPINQLLPAYCTVIYRNKVIAHHDVKRRHSYKWSDNKKRIVLVPMPEQFHIAKADALALMRLKSKYETVIPNLEEKTNEYILLKALFYGIPIGSLGLITDDRKEINSIAERGGCESLAANEVVNALDEFAMAVVSVI
jgi:hypothetical protein